MRDSLVFYRSFFEAIKNLPDSEFKEVVIAILDYGMNDKEPKLNGIAEVIFTLVKPQIDANTKRFEDGKKGGRPKKEATSDDAGGAKEVKHKHGTNQKVMLTDKELETLQSEFGKEQTQRAVEFLDLYIAEKGYKSKSHYLAIRRWVLDAIKEKKGNVKSHNFNERSNDLDADIMEKFNNL